MPWWVLRSALELVTRPPDCMQRQGDTRSECLAPKPADDGVDSLEIELIRVATQRRGKLLAIHGLVSLLEKKAHEGSFGRREPDGPPLRIA